jgi:hypothetical protein
MSSDLDESPWGYEERRKAKQAAELAHEKAQDELRDRFAIAAMTAILMREDAGGREVARWAYQYAKCMMEEREK